MNWSRVCKESKFALHVRIVLGRLVNLCSYTGCHQYVPFGLSYWKAAGNLHDASKVKMNLQSTQLIAFAPGYIKVQRAFESDARNLLNRNIFLANAI
jgi:hypothetical protein